MRVLRLILLCLLAYVLSVVFLFPAAPVVERFKPQMQLVQLDGVAGKLFKGSVASVKYTDDLLPLEFSNVAWRLAPKTLLNGGAGATITYDGYGGGGGGDVLREWDGDISVRDFSFTAQAKELEALLPVPIAQFSGALAGELDQLTLQNQLLVAMQGVLQWKDAVLEAPVGNQQVQTALGTIDLTIKPEGSDAHVATVKAAGGDLIIDGSVNLALNGDFSANVLFTPTDSAAPGVINGLRQFARPEPGGAFRLQQSGNVNKLM